MLPVPLNSSKITSSIRLPVSIKEYLTLLEAMQKGVIGPSVDDFYYLSRSALVKDEANFDKFDRAFGEFWQGVETIPGIEAQIPLEWLLKQVELTLSEEEKKQIEALGGWEKLMETLKQRLEEQKGRHQGGSKWIGTGGTSPFGAYGYNPEGIRIGQDRSRNRSAVKVWDQREYRNLDDSVELGTRNIKVALRRLRKFARDGAPDEFDLENTIGATARKAYLDIHMRPERRNTVKVLMLMDVGGTMDDHVKLAEELFSAAKTEFKHLEFYYFHNCLYDFVWKDNRRRHAERTRTWDIFHKYGHDYKVIFVGDATMSPYEILQPGGQRVLDQLGVLVGARDRGACELDGFQVLQDERLLLDIEYRRLDAPYDCLLALPQKHLLTELLDACQELPGFSLLEGHRVNGLLRDATQAYTASMVMFSCLGIVGLVFAYFLFRSEKGPKSHGLETITIGSTA